MTADKDAPPVDLQRIDAHVISEREYDEIPELTDEDFARVTWSSPRTVILDEDVLARFRATGPGWEARINRILRAAADALDAA